MARLAAFDAETVAALRQAVWDAWMNAVPPDTPEGWSRSAADPVAMVSALPGLRLVEGMTLRGYQHRHRGDGRGVVWALPADAPFPAPEDCPGDPPRPPHAADPMSAIGGDDSPLSYLAASILSRELAEFGAVGHGVSWLAETVLGSDPWDSRADVAFLGPVKGPTAPPDKWDWREPIPNDWRPTVRARNGAASVRFVTFGALGNEAITAHADEYVGGYLPRSSRAVIAVGPGGFVL